jgi:hypothetical protein
MVYAVKMHGHPNLRHSCSPLVAREGPFRTGTETNAQTKHFPRPSPQYSNRINTKSTYKVAVTGTYGGTRFETLEEYDRKAESLRKRDCEEWEL